MSLRYATIQNLQASGEAEPESGVETVNGLGAGSQRKAYQDTNEANSHNKNLGVANTERLNTLFSKANIDLVGYNPLNVILQTIDLNDKLNENPDYNNINLNYETDIETRAFNLSHPVKDSKAKDQPQHGAPNVKITPEDLKDPDGKRDFTSSPRRDGGFGIKYNINDIKSGKEKRQKIGTYLTLGVPIHKGGSTSRLGKSDPAGAPYAPSGEE